MDTMQLQNYLYEHIPLTKSMGIIVQKVTEEEVILEAPIAPNINHKKTVFGGSLHSIATLACWSVIYINVKKLEFPTEIVIAQSNISYLFPVISNFSAMCRIEDNVNIAKFEKMLEKKGKARLILTAVINQGNKRAVDYEGEFVALRQFS